MIINSTTLIDESEVIHYFTRNGIPLVQVMFFPGCHGAMYNPLTDVLIDKNTYMSLAIGNDKIEVE